MNTTRLATALLCATLWAPVPLWADPPVIVAAKATASGGQWRFDVTLRHGDTGWDDYAQAWRVVAPDGTVLGTRTLLHPHVDEQPFTRSLNGVVIPNGVQEVMIEARSLDEDWTATPYALTLP